MENEKMLEEARKNSDELYNSDIVYKTLVDNYINASAECDKKQLKLKKDEKIDTSKVSEAINALAKYKDELHRKSVLQFVEYLNISNEDIRDMLCDGIIDYKTIEKILKFKGIIEK